MQQYGNKLHVHSFEGLEAYTCTYLLGHIIHILAYYISQAVTLAKTIIFFSK